MTVLKASFRGREISMDTDSASLWQIHGEGFCQKCGLDGRALMRMDVRLGEVRDANTQVPFSEANRLRVQAALRRAMRHGWRVCTECCPRVPDEF